MIWTLVALLRRAQRMMPTICLLLGYMYFLESLFVNFDSQIGKWTFVNVTFNFIWDRLPSRFQSEHIQGNHSLNCSFRMHHHQSLLPCLFRCLVLFRWQRSLHRHPHGCILKIYLCQIEVWHWDDFTENTTIADNNIILMFFFNWMK